MIYRYSALPNRPRPRSMTLPDRQPEKRLEQLDCGLEDGRALRQGSRTRATTRTSTVAWSQ